jgi:hypothetical protein
MIRAGPPARRFFLGRTPFINFFAAETGEANDWTG